MALRDWTSGSREACATNPLRPRSSAIETRCPRTQPPNRSFESCWNGVGSRLELETDPLEFGHLINDCLGVVAPHAAALDASERDLRFVVHALIIDVDHPCLDRVGHKVAALEVARVN